MASHSWIFMLMFAASFITMFTGGESAYEADKIVKLPGQREVDFQQYAGYVLVDETQKRKLFCYFVEATTNSTFKPLVLWLNGGPGCSSIGLGAFSQHGPFKPNAAGLLVKNDYRWNKEANMLYLESPAGVGFSYSANTSFYELVNDTITGHYVPQLAQLIVESGSNLNLKGIAIGNPLLEFDTDFNGEGEYYWSHGLISDQTYQLINTVCNISQLRREAMSHTLSEQCKMVATQLAGEIPKRNFDAYDVTSDVCISQFGIKKQSLAASFHPITSLKSSQGALRKLEAGESIDLCVRAEKYTYLNRKDVQQAMHAELEGIPSWNSCSTVMKYDSNNLEISTVGILGSLVGSGIRVLVYSGDQDSVIPFFGTRKLVNRLATGMGLNTTVPYKAWFDFDKQVGGWTQVYGENNKLSFATIRGASHMAPFSSLALFAAFVDGKPLAA
ncbi:unnamed protein product [Linum trigynum]|uniref:Serine carboxypeptidase-like 45 n=1 Tax=Linum trigynum TaxID=586398 RepID=A0AAV2EMK1_9ROSI